ncbi:MAG: hypothetical protein IH845_02480 [Nanoarchaeota archaeon]|nr:hypothetical protein [Nanoarchaeota archaeon]
MIKKKVNKKAIIMVALLIGLFTISFASAGLFSDLWGNITGYASFGDTIVNLTIGNTAPTITFVTTVSDVDPIEDSTRTFIINFTADDDDGASDLDVAQMNVTSSGEAERINSSCATQGSPFGNSQNYTCTINLYYFDANAVWTVNATINDSAGTVVSNSTISFTFNILLAMKMSPTQLDWPSLTITSTDIGSNTDPITINNTGNDAITNITVNATDLAGETTATEYIYAENFTVNTADASDNTTMINNTEVQVDLANLTRGNYSLNDGVTGQEELYFYLEALNSDLSSQSYSSAAGAQWTVTVVT